MSPTGNGLENRFHIFRLGFVWREGDPDRSEATDAGRHYSCETAINNRRYDLIVELIEPRLNFRFLLMFHKAIRHVAKAVFIARRLVNYVEVRVFADKIV